MPHHYAVNLAKAGIKTLKDVMDCKNSEVNKTKAILAVSWYEKNLGPYVEELEDENFGIRTEQTEISLSEANSSKLIRHAIMDQTFDINTPICINHRYKSIQTYNEDKARLALQKIAKIRSIRLRNHMLRVINGDVFSKDRMKRFGMINDDICDNCGQIETKEHLLLECTAARKLWEYFSTIYKSTHGRPYKINLLNVLNCGDNYNSLATTTIIAELVKRQVLNRPIYRNISEVSKLIKEFVNRETSASKHYKIKIDKSWIKWSNLCEVSNDDGCLLGSRDEVEVRLNQLAAAELEVEDEGDAEAVVPEAISNVITLESVTQASIDGDS
jgi:hypothetical protein